MKHSRLDIILQAICVANDYSSVDSIFKLEELKGRLRPINSSMANKEALKAMYIILADTIEIIKEIECLNVTTVEEKDLNLIQDSKDILTGVK